MRSLSKHLVSRMLARSLHEVPFRAVTSMVSGLGAQKLTGKKTRDAFGTSPTALAAGLQAVRTIVTEYRIWNSSGSRLCQGQCQK